MYGVVPLLYDKMTPLGGAADDNDGLALLQEDFPRPDVICGI